MVVNDPLSGQHVLVMLGHVLLDVVEPHDSVAAEDDAPDGAVRAVLFVGQDAVDLCSEVASNGVVFTRYSDTQELEGGRFRTQNQK